MGDLNGAAYSSGSLSSNGFLERGPAFDLARPAPEVPAPGVGALGEQALELAARLPGTLSRLVVRDGDLSVEVEWSPVPAGGTWMAHRAVADPSQSTPGDAGEVPDTVALPPGAVEVRAPLVGVWYAAPAPGEAPFAAVGDAVVTGQTLGIIEAMKLMNRVVAEVDGTVDRVLVVNGEPVEYDQALFVLSPSEVES